MKNRTIIFTQRHDDADWCGRGFGVNARLCSYEVRHILDIPKNVNKFFAVFSTEIDDDEAAFTIKQPQFSFRRSSDVSGLVEFSRRLLHVTQTLLARAHDAGYRYVEVEYEDNGE